MRRAAPAAAFLLAGLLAAEPVAPVPSASGANGGERNREEGASIALVTRQYHVQADPATGRLVRQVKAVRRSAKRPAASAVGSGSQVVQGGLTSGASNGGSDRVDLEALIRRAADRYDIEARLIRAVIRQESGFDPYAISTRGAQGLMQLMPETAAELGIKDVFDPAENILGGVRFLRQLLNLYDGDLRLALAAYNAGPGAVQKYGGAPPFAETREYLERIVGMEEDAAAVRKTANQAETGHDRIVYGVGPGGTLRFETAAQ